MNLYMIYDVKAETFGIPFGCRSHGEAMRSFVVSCKERSAEMDLFAGDYRLWYLCEFDQASGDVVKNGQCMEIMNGIEAMQIINKEG